MQTFKVAEIIAHADYKFSSTYNDLALIRLEGAAVVNDNVAPACIWSDKEVDFAKLEATGWGYTGFGNFSKFNP